MKKLKTILPKNSGRGAKGRVSVRHQGGRMKRFLRDVDFKRDKIGVWARVEEIEYDPNRNAKVALVIYSDGERRYILAPNGLNKGAKIIASESAPIEVGNTLPIGKIPVGTQIHALEVTPGKGGQLVRGAGSAAVIQGKEEYFVVVKMPSGELRRFDPKIVATIGQMGNPEARTVTLGTAGRHRRMGIRPTVRGVAMHPKAHPHGGGEGRSSVGMKFPKTPWGKKAVGKTRKKNKYSNKLIISRKKSKQG